MLLSEKPPNKDDAGPTQSGAESIPPYTQNANMSPTMEQYVEAIAHLLQQDKVCTVSEIAKAAQVTRPAASRAVRGLVKHKLVVHKSYGYVDLTDKGRELAEKLSTRHKILYDFFTRILGLNREWSDNEACRLEHQMDDTLIQRLERLRSFIEKDPKYTALWQASLQEDIK